MLRTAVGISANADSYTAAANAAESAFSLLGGSPNLVFVFASSNYSFEEVISVVKKAAPTAIVAGTTTAGEISSSGPSNRPSVVVFALVTDQVTFAGGVGHNMKKDSFTAGKEMAKTITDALGNDIAFATIFPDGLSGNGSAVVRGALSVFGQHFPLIGGSSGDDGLYKQTFQSLDGEVFTDSVVGVGWSKGLTFGVGVRHGWIPVGYPMKVTKSDGSILSELDGKPAISIYEDYLGPSYTEKLKSKTLAELAILYPLGMRISHDEEFLLRAPFFVNEDGSIVCGGEITQDAEVQLMVGSKEEAVAAARIAATHAKDQLNGKEPKAAIIFSCHVRDKLYGTRERAQKEIHAIQEVIGNSVPMAGFYTYAEQAPINGEVRNIEKCVSSVHNETIVILLIAE